MTRQKNPDDTHTLAEQEGEAAVAATQANASKPEIHTAPFIGSPPALSELDAANLPAGTVLAIAVPAAATQRRDAGPVTAGFDNKLAGRRESRPRPGAA
ncbi:hypothetical protein [Actinomadura welshii]|uniref:hypothetical protein n=1 Tax=Actinomadura welshii TaxID=3103817 RepID=UPI0003AD56EC|nr:hypothetical protein [Actinomadura madurae]